MSRSSKPVTRGRTGSTKPTTAQPKKAQRSGVRDGQKGILPLRKGPVSRRGA